MLQNNENSDSFLFYHQKSNSFFQCEELTSGILYFSDHAIDLSTGERVEKNILHFEKEMNALTVDQFFSQPKIITLFYDYGLKQVEKLPNDKPLAIIAEFSKVNQYKFDNVQKPRLEDVKTLSEDEYGEMFDKVQDHLIKGNCYQINLTTIVDKKISNKSFRDICNYFFNHVERISPYAHAFNLKHWNFAYISNSPECLFQKRVIEKKNERLYELYTMPIKGTIPSRGNPDEAFKKLLSSKKDKAELYMISDLMRNDLTKVSFSPARIIKSRAKLVVPNLVHQYSLITAEVSAKTSLLRVIECLFPGGSITGAPKKKVIELIDEIEQGSRGYYCSSTIFCFKEQISASINIRSMTLNKSSAEVFYGSGGGITLNSGKYDEYNELLQKILSFFSHF